MRAQIAPEEIPGTIEVTADAQGGVIHLEWDIEREARGLVPAEIFINAPRNS